MSRAIICYPDPQKRDLVVNLVNGQGKVFDPAAGSFGDNPAEAAIPLSRVAATDLSSWQVAVVPKLPPDSGPVLAFVLPAAGGAAVDAPIPIVTSAESVTYGVAFEF